MSRSIHVTYSQIAKEYKRQRTKEIPENGQKLDKLHSRMRRKIKAKRQIISQRRTCPIYISTDPDIFLITKYDENEFIHYPADEKDIREVLKRLPNGIIDGLKCIELRLGKGEEKRYKDLPDPDPYTGRPGFEMLPGVFQPKVLGIYESGKKVIVLCAYVYKNIPDFEIWNVCLKMYMLMALAHELSHHFDFQHRMARGRWFDGDRKKVESYANDMEYKWADDYIVPYIEDTYKEEVNALNSWMLLNIGVKIPLSIIAGDPRSLRDSYPTDDYFFDFVKDIYEGKDSIRSRIILARGFCNSKLYGLSLEIINVVLEIEPENVVALELKEVILVNKEKVKSDS